jgi:hypothetical protein
MVLFFDMREHYRFVCGEAIPNVISGLKADAEPTIVADLAGL